MTSPRPKALIALCLGLVCCAGKSCSIEGPKKAQATCASKTLSASRAETPPHIDGKLDEPEWLKTATSGPLAAAVGTGSPVPHTEVRAVWDDQALVIGLYAADEDIGDADQFEVDLEEANARVFTLELAASGRLRCRLGQSPCPQLPEVTAAADSDGTLNDAGDDDEEWTAELRVPWSTLGFSGPPSRVAMNVRRTDQPKGTPERHLVWSAPCEGLPSGGVVLLQPNSDLNRSGTRSP